MRLGEKQSEGGAQRPERGSNGIWVYILALLEVRRSETAQGLAIGGVTEKVTGHTGIAMNGKRGFHGESVQGRKERVQCWELEEYRLQLYAHRPRSLGLTPSVCTPTPASSPPRLYILQKWGASPPDDLLGGSNRSTAYLL